MEPVKYNIKKNKNPKTQENTEVCYSETKRETAPITNDTIENENSSALKRFFLKKKVVWIPILIIVLLTIIIISVVIPISNKKDKDEKIKNKSPNKDIKEEIQKIFSPSFKINSKVDTLTKLSQKSYQNYETTINGEKSTFSIFSKAIYDIYTLNSISSFEDDKIYYSNIYNTAIVVNSLCAKFSSISEQDDCQLEKYFDLNEREVNNLRRTEENYEELLKSAILPICIVEHTDTNLIISLNCPETLEDSFKNDIIKAFQNIKPDSMKGFEFDKNYVNTILEEKNDKIYITSFDNICQDPNIDPTKSIICNLTKNIITDKEGNLISSKTSSSEKTTKDKNNKFINTFTYEYENIPKEKSSNFNQETFKLNLNTFLPMIRPLMKKEIYISNFTDLAKDIMQEEDQIKIKNDLRALSEQASISRGIQEENIFNKTLTSDISIFFSLKNDIGLGADKSAKAKSIHNINDKNKTELSNGIFTTNLNEIMNKFIILSKSGNILANKLYNELNEPLLKLGGIVSKNIEKINNILANKDISEIFDSTFAIKQLNNLRYEFVVETDNLYNSMNELSKNILYTINNAKEKLKKDVSDFIASSHNLIFKLINKISDLTNSLASEKSKIVEISSYYFNNTDTSYFELIQKVKNITDNYYKKEKEQIIPLVNNLLEKFYENTIKCIEENQKELDEINERLNDGNLIILLASNEDYQKTIKNIYNTKQKANEITETIKIKFKESISIKSNGYFESQDEIEENNKSYSQIIDRALSISYTLDKNELIDKTFDNVWISIRGKTLSLLEYMNKSIKEKFPLEENVLRSSLFDVSYKVEFDNFLNKEKSDILQFINEENNNYLNSINNYLTTFKSENEKSLDQIISGLMNQLTALNLDDLNKAFKDSLNLTFNSITEILQNNTNNAYGYLNDAQIASSYHITDGFKNKYNTFYNSILKIEAFVNQNLKNNLDIKYKNSINQIRIALQSIKSNKILEKYYKQLPSAESHLNSIKDLFNIFEKYFSDSVYNTQFLPLINNFIQRTNNVVNKTKHNFENIYNTISKKPSDSKTHDFDVQRIDRGGRYCCKRIFGHCIRYRYYPDIISYIGNNVVGTNNHLNLKDINFLEYTKNYDNKYELFYQQFSNNVNSYNSLLLKLDSFIESKKNEYISSKTNYLKNIPEKIDSILEEKFGKNLLQSSYNYFKNKITNELPNELSNFLNQWEHTFDEIYDEINSNKDKFKSKADEFLNIPLYFIELYKQNISYDFGISVVDKLKNEFSYTNKYYYNLLISKIKTTYTYILNNIPINENPFDGILNFRIDEIKKSYENIIKKIQNSKNEIVDENKQKTILQVNDNNFFLANDIISEHIKNFEISMNDKIANLASLIEEITNESPKELMVAKFYLENSINGKQMKEIYDSINKVTFIDLQNNIYQKLIDDILKIDKDELIQNIRNTLIKLNENIYNNFKYENEQFIQIIENKLYKEFFSKEDLDNKIVSFYNNGIINTAVISKNQIYEIINLILNKIKLHITNEASRLCNELTSYSNDLSNIENRLNNYKINIYEKVYSTITYVINDIHQQILEKFYQNFIKKWLNDYQNHLENIDFGNAQFLNMSINLNEILKKKSNLILSEYNNLTLNQIEFIFQKKIQNLDEQLNFSTIKSKIYEELDSVYNSKLFPALKKAAVHNSGEVGISDYDLSNNIINDIDTYINEQLNNMKQIMKKTEGNKDDLNNLTTPDFSDGKNSIYDEIKNRFKNFSLFNTDKEKKEFNKFFSENVINNFKSFIDNFVPSFGIDFFKRIVRFNEIQKIKWLYNKLKYSLAQTNAFYIILATINSDLRLPEDIKLKLLTLNNLDSIVTSNNNFIISTLNNKLNNFFDETKIYIIEKYIKDMTTSPDFDLKFNENLKNIIKGIISGNEYIYEKIYIDIMEQNIKTTFIKEYSSTLDLATEDMKSFIDIGKIELKIELDNIFTLSSDSVLLEIQNKLDETVLAEAECKHHFSIFNISEEVYDFLYNFGNNFIFPKYKNIKDLLNKRTEELIINNLDKLSNEFINEYSLDKFKEEVNKANQNISTYFNSFESILNNYGHIESIYSKNLEIEKANYNESLRRLDNDNINEQKFSDLKLDKTFNELKNLFLLSKNSVESLKLFLDFEDKMNNYINKKNHQYSYTEYVLDNHKEKDSNYDLMKERYEQLKNLSSEYYSNANSIYKLMKEEIINNIKKINNLLNSCEEVTYDTIKNEYNELKNNFNKIEELQDDTKEEISIPISKFNQTNNYFTLETKIKNYLIHNKIYVDLLYNDESKTPKVIGRVENNIKPQIFDIDFYAPIGQKGKLGRKIELILNNITSYTNIIFDAGTSNATIVTNFNFDEYNYIIKHYEEKEISISKKILGVVIFLNITTPQYNITLEEKKDIPLKNKTIIENYDF